MKRFVVKLLIFLFPVVIVVGFIEYSLSQVPNSYNKKKAFFEKQVNNLEVLITGNSQALFGINPTYFSKKTFNISNVSQELYYDSALIINYLAQLDSLKMVIIQLSYTSLYVVPMEHSPEEWRCYYYKRFWNIPNKNLSVFNMKNYSYISLYSWEETKELLSKKFNADLAQNLYPNGFMKMDTANNSLGINDSLGEQRVKVHEDLMSEKYFTQNYNPLKSLIEKLKKKNIEVLLVLPPVCSTYYKYCNPAFLQKNDSVIKSLCNKYNLHCFDYFMDSSYNKTDFLDNDHLNYIGASHFSMILNADITKFYFK